LKDEGLNSLPGGGAEIFAPSIREQICPEKANAEEWLSIHRTAHQLGIPSNATMLYGHMESYADRIDHMERLRTLQDETHGFNAFIPLKFRNADNKMSQLPEVCLLEDLKNYAVSRLFLDNFSHLKAYWPMLGKQSAALALDFGVDDLDGTIQDSTKIYTMAGVEEKPVMTAEAMQALIKEAGKIPVERDALYQPV
jgi:aminodeoxyfutalosine synthase